MKHTHGTLQAAVQIRQEASARVQGDWGDATAKQEEERSLEVPHCRRCNRSLRDLVHSSGGSDQENDVMQRQVREL